MPRQCPAAPCGGVRHPSRRHCKTAQPRRREIIEFAAKHRLPTVYSWMQEAKTAREIGMDFPPLCSPAPTVIE